MLRPPSITITSAARASTVFRISVDGPAGAEWSCPKQWQSGVRPFRRFWPIAMRNTMNSSAAPRAAHRATGSIRSPIASSPSATGRMVPSAGAYRPDTPKSRTACREPGRSASFPTAATSRTTASATCIPTRTVSTISYPVRAKIDVCPACMLRAHGQYTVEASRAIALPAHGPH